MDEVFSSLSTVPVASASLGQVYKGRLRDIYGGGEVAVKVQRPSVQASVALDLLLMRRFAAFCQTFPQVPSLDACSRCWSRVQFWPCRTSATAVLCVLLLHAFVSERLIVLGRTLPVLSHVWHSLALTNACCGMVPALCLDFRKADAADKDKLGRSD